MQTAFSSGTLVENNQWQWITDRANNSIAKKLAGVSNLLASLGHTGRRRVVLGHTLNTQTLMKADEQQTGFKSIYDFVLGLIHSHPGPRVGLPC